MSVLVELLGSFSPGHVITHEGRDYVFGAIDQRKKAALTVAYFKRAREAVYAIKDEVEADDYDRQLGRVMDAYRRGQYDFPGLEAFGYYVGPGIAEMVACLTGCRPAEAQALLEAMPVEVLHVVLCVVYASLGEQDKKKLASLEDSPAIRPLVELLQSARTSSPIPSTNGSASSPRTSAPASPVAASTSTSSQA